MEIKIKRISSQKNSIIGYMAIDGDFECYTIERPDKDNAPDVSCIPTGTYKLGFRMDLTEKTNHYRKKFNWFRWHLQIMDVKDRTAIYIHIANKPEDLKGCVGVADQAYNNRYIKDWIGSSSPSYERMYKKIANAINTGNLVSIEIG